MKNLVIVESPAKAKTIKHFLGNDFEVRASMGHVRDLPKKELGVDIENKYEPKYIISPDKKKVVQELKGMLKKDTKVLLATDEDREGESIAWHLAKALSLDEKKTDRIVFHEITKPAIMKALENPRKIDFKLLDSQQARRVIDRLVGYKLSPLLWRMIRPGLSAGRVQSVAVRLIVEREREIENFKPEEFWDVKADLKAKNGDFIADLEKKDDKKLKITNKKDADKVLKDLEKEEYVVSNIEKKEGVRTPAPPFITSTLQQEASRKLGFSVKQTMVIAQQLYEGVDLENEIAGLITYMRTDSTNLSEQALTQAPKVIAEEFGKEYALAAPRFYKSKVKGAQEAHEAIRPTDFSRTPKSVKAYLEPAQFKLYKLIWERAIASQMKEAILDLVTVDIQAGAYSLVAKGQTIKFAGFMKAYIEDVDNEEEALAHKEKILPEILENEKLKLNKLLPEQKFTQPPPRYTEASLVKKLESEGIGRPSTYAPTISTIIARGYIVKKQDKKLYPEEVGVIVNDFLVEHFPKEVDYKFTAELEEDLDSVADGEKDWVKIVDDFYKPFAKLLAEKSKTVRKGDILNEKTDEVCDLCGAPMVVKFSRRGKFLSCSAWPKCKNAKPMKEDRERQEQLMKEIGKQKCENCGSDMVIKKGRFGEFLACSNYPKCKTTKAIEKDFGVACPECGGKIVERRSKRGKVFYGCSNYPKCTFALWYKPVKEACPKCGGIQVQMKNGLKCTKCEKQNENEE